MVNQELLNYIKQQTVAGVSREIIVATLLSQGWSQADVDAAFLQINANASAVPLPQIAQTALLEKKHDVLWVVLNIVLRGGIVGGPIFVLCFIVAGIVTINLGFDAQKIAAYPELKIYFFIGYQLFELIIYPAAYLGIRWGCKYVAKNTFIEEKDFGRIGRYVGLIPAVFSIARSFSIAAWLYGVFLTPNLVKKWLKKYSTEVVV